MKVLHERISYTHRCVISRITINEDFKCYSIERPWKRHIYPGGMPFESCIPDGVYKLQPFVRRSGEKAYVFVNPDLGVYRSENDMPDGRGRYECLYHAGNVVDHVVGCAAVGERFIIYENQEFVTNSVKTMKTVRSLLGNNEHEVEIFTTSGAHDRLESPSIKPSWGM